jgi:hypothetical protein
VTRPRSIWCPDFWHPFNTLWVSVACEGTGSHRRRGGGGCPKMSGRGGRQECTVDKTLLSLMPGLLVSFQCWRADLVLGIASLTGVKGDSSATGRFGVSCLVFCTRFDATSRPQMRVYKRLIDKGEGGSGRRTSGMGGRSKCHTTTLWGLSTRFLLLSRCRADVLVREECKQGFVERARVED